MAKKYYFDEGNELTLGDGAATTLLLIDGAAGAVRDLTFRSAGSSRWTVRADSAAESGSDAGSNLEVVRRDDAGAEIDKPIEIERSTGDITFGPTSDITFGASATIDFGGMWVLQHTTGTLDCDGGPAGDLAINVRDNSIQFVESALSGNPSPNSVWLYAIDDSGDTKLVVKFPTGEVITVAEVPP